MLAVWLRQATACLHAACTCGSSTRATLLTRPATVRACHGHAYCRARLPPQRRNGSSASLTASVAAWGSLAFASEGLAYSTAR